ARRGRAVRRRQSRHRRALRRRRPEGPSPVKTAWRALAKKKMSLLGAGLIGFFALVALAAPLLAPAPPNARDSYLIPQDGYSPDPVTPTFHAEDGHPAHLFGTTEQQYDLYYGMVWGTRTAFRVALKVVGLSLLIGLIVGGLSGFYGGWVDELL